MSETPYKPADWDKRIAQLGGTNFKGEPNLRTVWAPNERKWNGAFKYPNPENYALSMELWVLEVWYPAHFFGNPQDWKADVCGPFPREGLYGMKTPLMTGDGKMLPLNDSTFEAIQRKQLADVEWKSMDAKARFEFINEQQAQQEKYQMEQASKEYHEIFDEYHHHADHEVKADTRLWTFPQALQPNMKGGKRTVQDK